MVIKFALIHPLAKLPKYAHETDSGMDITSVEDVVIRPHTHATIKTGICAEIEDGYELQVRPKSGMCAAGLVTAFGTVDTGYRGQIYVTVYNHTDYEQQLLAGSKVGQLVVAPVVRAKIEIVESVSTDTDRGTNGFGSTGK